MKTETCERRGSIKGSTRWHVLLVREEWGQSMEDVSSRTESIIWGCLQSSKRANVKRCSQFGGGTGVGSEHGGWGRGIRWRWSWWKVTAAVQGEDTGNGHIYDALTELRVEFPGGEKQKTDGVHKLSPLQNSQRISKMSNILLLWSSCLSHQFSWNSPESQLLTQLCVWLY